MKKLLLVLALLACSHPLDNLAIIEQEGAVQFSPYPLYLDRWKHLEACSGLHADYYAVTWYRSPYISVRDTTYQGAYLGKYNAIVIAEPQLLNIKVIDHEEMHALLWPVGGHPAAYFNGNCGDLRAP